MTKRASKSEGENKEAARLALARVRAAQIVDELGLPAEYITEIESVINHFLPAGPRAKK
jgi:hypothetical protein